MPKKHTPTLLSEVERVLKERAEEEGVPVMLSPSSATAVTPNARIDSLVLPDEERGKMPLTKDAYLIRESPHLVAWEREVRKFLRNLSPDHEHRISAVMIYEWATGLRIPELVAEEANHEREAGKRTWRSDLRAINKLLTEYFGKPRMTHIGGRKVPRAYRVKPGYYIYRHRPRTLTLWVEWREGAKL